MHFADLKNDFLFRRIFARHPELTLALLNDLLDRQGDERIVELEVIPAEQAPEVAGAKLSILDVKCRDQSGRVFVVEMQMLHIAGFLNRVVYNACKAYVGQLPRGSRYSQLADVVAVSLCDFVIWPDQERDREGLPRVPLVSRWSMKERVSGAEDLRQVQYAFVELPKVPLEGPLQTPAEQWAWMFRIGAHEGALPESASDAQRKVLELCNEATWTEGEREAYFRVLDEIGQARQLERDAEGRGRAVGLRDGRAEGERRLREAIVDLCELLGVELDDSRRNQLDGLDLDGLEALRLQLKQQRRWALPLRALAGSMAGWRGRWPTPCSMAYVQRRNAEQRRKKKQEQPAPAPAPTKQPVPA